MVVKVSLKFVFIAAVTLVVLCYIIFNDKAFTTLEPKLIQVVKLNFSTIIPKFYEYINIVKPIVIKHSFLQGFLQCNTRRLNMYVHYRGDSISNSILMSSKWEAGMVVQFENYINTHPGIQVMDVGCNLGVYTLAAAALGCRVVAIDANPSNTDRLMQSLLVNGLEKNVNICLNAMSNARKNFIIQVMDSSNVGGSRVQEAENNNKSVKTIYMDDLIPFFDKDKEVAIKMDIEGKEIDALKQASNFFNERNVTFVMMEWEHIKTMGGIKDVLDFFTARNFTPYNNCAKNLKLNLSLYLQWPFDICWLK